MKTTFHVLALFHQNKYVLFVWETSHENETVSLFSLQFFIFHQVFY